MSKNTDVMIALPVNSFILSEEEMRLVEGGSWKKEVGKFMLETIGSWVVQSGIEHVWNNREKYWNKFVKAAAKHFKKHPEQFEVFKYTYNNAIRNPFK